MGTVGATITEGHVWLALVASDRSDNDYEAEQVWLSFSLSQVCQIIHFVPFCPFFCLMVIGVFSCYGFFAFY